MAKKTLKQQKRNPGDKLWQELIKCDVRAFCTIVHNMTLKAAQRVYDRLYVVKPDNFETQGKWTKLDEDDS